MLDALAEAERNFGRLHIACNNAGVPMHGVPLVDVTPADWQFVIGVAADGTRPRAREKAEQFGGAGASRAGGNHIRPVRGGRWHADLPRPRGAGSRP